MPFDPCSPCGCVPANIDDRLFHQMATNLLCSINDNISTVTGGGSFRYDIEILCDPGDSRPIIVRYDYKTDGTVQGISAFELTGAVYAGVIADLTACSGGGGGGGNVNLTQVGGAAITLGQKLSVASLPVVLPSDQIVSSNITQVGGASLTLGQDIGVNSVPVVLASDVVVDIVAQGTPSGTNPNIPNTTSTTLIAANAARKYLLIQNNSGANVAISLSGAVLTSIVPSNANPAIVLLPNATYESPPNFCPTNAITVYQSSGLAIETISVVEA